MKSRDFCYWLQGYIELSKEDGGLPAITPSKLRCIENHLKMVFVHEIDPSFKGPTSSLMDAIHRDKTELMKC